MTTKSRFSHKLNRLYFADKKGVLSVSTPAGNSFNIEALLEAIHTAARVNQLLLAGVERMALGANIHLHLFLGRSGLKSFTAYAANHALTILGMNIFLHCCFTSFAYAMAVEPQKVY